jgi:UDP-glucose 4-epimerase
METSFRTNTWKKTNYRCDAAFGLKYVCLRYFNACGADASGDLGEDHDPESHLIPIVLQVPRGAWI